LSVCDGSLKHRHRLQSIGSGAACLLVRISVPQGRRDIGPATLVLGSDCFTEESPVGTVETRRWQRLSRPFGTWHIGETQTTHRGAWLISQVPPGPSRATHNPVPFEPVGLLRKSEEDVVSCHLVPFSAELRWSRWIHAAKMAALPGFLNSPPLPALLSVIGLQEEVEAAELVLEVE
jgi:hypothetical protein